MEVILIAFMDHLEIAVGRTVIDQVRNNDCANSDTQSICQSSKDLVVVS